MPFFVFDFTQLVRGFAMGLSSPDTIQTASETSACFVLHLDSDVHSPEAVWRVCYALLDVAGTEIGRDDATGALLVTVFPRTLSYDPASFRRRFFDLLTDFQTRMLIEAQTAEIRDTLVKAALSTRHFQRRRE